MVERVFIEVSDDIFKEIDRSHEGDGDVVEDSTGGIDKDQIETSEKLVRETGLVGHLLIRNDAGVCARFELSSDGEGLSVGERILDERATASIIETCFNLLLQDGEGSVTLGVLQNLSRTSRDGEVAGGS